MRKLYTLLIAVILTASAFAQAPEKMSYQAVVRDAGNALVSSTAVGMQLSILQGSATGTAVYVETQTPNTNINGLVSIEIGSGTVVSGTFNTIDWSAGPYFIKTETDPTGGTTYTITGTSQLMSVPYALHANTADSIVGGVSFTEVDGSVTNEIQTISRTGTTVTLSNGGGAFEDSVNVYTAGTGIDVTNNVISTTEPTYTIGLWPELGGYVFWVSTDGKHGLVADTQDQGNTSWFDAKNLIARPANHSVDGQKFRDWRMPTKYELNEMYLQDVAIGGFANSYYWSSTEIDNVNAWREYFGSGHQYSVNKTKLYDVRAVRAF
jgi:hypothetical protein